MLAHLRGRTVCPVSAIPAALLEYPAAAEVDVALRDGTSVHIRPVQASDRAPLRAFFAGLSSEALVSRFFGIADLDWAADWSVDVDYADRYALVATAGSDHTIIAHSAYVRIDSERAEVAFVVADAWQGRESRRS